MGDRANPAVASTVHGFAQERRGEHARAELLEQPLSLPADVGQAQRRPGWRVRSRPCSRHSTGAIAIWRQSNMGRRRLRWSSRQVRDCHRRRAGRTPPNDDTAVEEGLCER